MPLSEVTNGWLLAAIAGLTLTALNPRMLFAPARWLRGSIWVSVVLFGEAASLPLYFAAILAGLCAALPIFASVMPVLLSGTVAHLSLVQGLLIAASIVFRLCLWPAIDLNWANVRQWEQEVVRRPRGRLRAYWVFANRPNRDFLALRAKQLGRGLAQSEFMTSQVFKFIPRQSLGLLLIYCSALGLTPENSMTQTQALLMVIAMCVVVFIQGILKTDGLTGKSSSFLLVILAPAFVFAGLPLLERLWPISLAASHVFIHDFARFAVLSAVLLKVGGDLEGLLKSRPKSGFEVGSAPVEKRYSVLTKTAQTAQWLAKPRHLALFFMQMDILLTTLRITLSWSYFGQ